MAKFTELIKKNRKERNMNAKQLSLVLHCSQQLISKIERGDAYPTPEMVEKMERLFNYAPGVLGEIVAADISNEIYKKYVKVDL